MSLEHDKTKCEETLQATLTKLHEAERQIDHINLEKEQLIKDVEHICMEKEEFKVCATTKWSVHTPPQNFALRFLYIDYISAASRHCISS